MTLSAQLRELAGKATQGPFAVNPFAAYIDSPQLDEDGDPTPIAALAWPTDYRSEEETQANGELIALMLTHRETIIAALELQERVNVASGDAVKLAGMICKSKTGPDCYGICEGCMDEAIEAQAAIQALKGGSQ